MKDLANIKVSIGLPHLESGVKVDTAISLMLTAKWLPCQIHLNPRKGTILHETRNQIIFEALSAECDYLMFIDSDMKFRQGSIERLISLEKDIVGVPYNMKSLPAKSTVKFMDDVGNLVSKPIPQDEPFQCAAVGGGFMLIDLKRLKEKMEYPYFDFDRKADGSLLGEDVVFCLKARKAGLEVWCDPTVKLGHIGEFVY